MIGHTLSRIEDLLLAQAEPNSVAAKRTLADAVAQRTPEVRPGATTPTYYEPAAPVAPTPRSKRGGRR